MCFVAAGAWAQQATLVADAHVSSAQPAVNAGTLSNLNVGGGYTALVQFDLGTLPAGITATQITRATLRVYCNRADTPGAVSVASVDAAWGEYSVTYATLPAAGSPISTANATAGEFVTFDVTPAVQAWVSAPTTNNGLALASNTAIMQFDSKENDQTAHAPELVVATAVGGGVAGLQGPTGPAGPIGATGTTGGQGPAGPIGLTGVIGPAGVPGVAGPAGAIGLQGPPGVAGDIGTAGPAGALGATGSMGPQGSTGPQGIAGTAGTAGTPGLVYRGAYNSEGNYALGDVVVWDGSSYASLMDSNHGNTPDLTPAYWGVLASVGGVGPAGPQGVAGQVGVQGLPGSVGPPGELGPQGLQGIAGQAGAQGIPGVAGTTGLQGPMGPQGVAGPVGLSFVGPYSSTTNYGVGDGVLWQGAGWVSVVASNHGNTPDQSPTSWEMFATAGTPGIAGAAGAIGAIGMQGPVGPQGVAGVDGAAGVPGAAGTPGLVYRGAYASTANYALGDVVVWDGSSYASLMDSNHGNTPDLTAAYWGVLASVGSVGPMGSQGMVGTQGPIGLTGGVGPQGPAGVQGPQGPEGPVGAQGLTGTTGAQGGVGPQGLQGIAGQAGAQGVVGPAGPAGSQGPTGEQGPQGGARTNGAAGEPGASGAPGLVYRGVYESGINYALGEVVVWDGSSYASLMDSNHGNTPDLNAAYWGVLASMGGVGPMGPQGVVGPQGPIGLIGGIGPQGPAGVQGSQGSEGPVGVQGLTGAAGAQGAVGPMGPQGVAGQAGAQGVVGPAGPAGPQGPTGEQGPIGANGTTGTAGLNGAVGINFRAAWNAQNNYAVNDAVTFAGSTYLAQTANNHIEPDSDAQTWMVIAQAGDAGATPSMSVGSVTTLTAGSPATVTVSGTAQAAVLNFGIPAGTTGPAGPTGPAGTSGASTMAASGNSFAAMYHPVNFQTFFYSVNTPTSSANEDSTVMAWVPLGCTATRLDVYSLQSGNIIVTLRNGMPGAMVDTLSCQPAASGATACPATGSVAINPGTFLDLHITGASSTAAGVWTAVQCN